MIRKYRHIIIALLITNLLVANVGLSMNWLYCYCKGQMQVSLFSLDEACHKKSADSGSENKCCKVSKNTTAKSSCCSKFDKYKKDKKPCTTKGKKYTNADIKAFFVEKHDRTFDNATVLSAALLPCNPPFEYQNMVYCTLANIVQQPNKAPPYLRPFGRNLLSIIQNFRC